MAQEITNWYSRQQMQSITTFDSTQRGKLDEGGFIDIIGRRPGVKRMAFLALIFLSVFLTLVQHSIFQCILAPHISWSRGLGMNRFLT